MKTLFCSLIFIFIGCQVSFAQIDYGDSLNIKRVYKYTRVKKKSRIIAITGGVITAASVVLIASAEWEQWNYGPIFYRTFDLSGQIGQVAILFGLPALIAGTLTNLNSSRKLKYYQGELDKVQIGYFQKNGAHGLSLKIRL